VGVVMGRIREVYRIPQSAYLYSHLAISVQSQS